MTSRPTSAASGIGRTSPGSPGERPRFLSEADCHTLLDRVVRVTSGGGHTAIMLHSIWTGNIRWARNLISTTGEVRTNNVFITRTLNGAVNATLSMNDTSDAGLLAAVRRAERLVRLDRERPQSDLAARYPLEEMPRPKLFSETTYQLDADKRSTAAITLAKTAADAGMLSAGYIEVSAHSLGVLDTYGRVRYFPYTQAQYSVTVRDPKGTGSGWAGVDYYDWSTIDGPKLSQIALEKCLQSRNAVKLEPGRYTVVLEPQAVSDFVGQLVRDTRPLSRQWNPPGGPFFKTVEPVEGLPEIFWKFGEKVIDERLTLSADPTDPELGFPPFSVVGGEWGLSAFVQPVFHPVTWIEHGVLRNLSYERRDAIREMGRLNGLPNSGAFRMSVSGPTNTVEEMIAATKRGLLVTRFDQVEMLDPRTVLCRGHTRDGLWLIENGRISRPVKNLYFTESALAALNRVEAVGVPQRIFNPPIVSPLAPFTPQPAVVPALKLGDFTFTQLDDAV